MREEEQLKEFIMAWIKKAVQDSNQGLLEKNQFHLREEKPVRCKVRVVDAQERAAFERKALPKGGIIELLQEGCQPIGNPHTEDRDKAFANYVPLTAEQSYGYENQSTEKKPADVKVVFTSEKIAERERTYSQTKSVNMGLTATVYNAGAAIGYNLDWNTTARERQELHQSSNVEVSIPVLIPPGGATYTFSLYHRPLFQDYQYDVQLRGTVRVYFEQGVWSHGIVYKEGKFQKSDDKGLKKSVEVSLADIIASLGKEHELIQVYFPRATHWVIDGDTVRYRNQISEFQFYKREIKTNAELNSSNPLLTQVTSVDQVEIPKEKEEIVKEIVYESKVGCDNSAEGQAQVNVSDAKANYAGVSLRSAAESHNISPAFMKLIDKTITQGDKFTKVRNDAGTGNKATGNARINAANATSKMYDFDLAAPTSLAHEASSLFAPAEEKAVEKFSNRVFEQIEKQLKKKFPQESAATFKQMKEGCIAALKNELNTQPDLTKFIMNCEAKKEIDSLKGCALVIAEEVVANCDVVSEFEISGTAIDDGFSLYLTSTKESPQRAPSFSP